MAEKIQAPRGTFDVLPEDAARRLALLRQCEDLFERRGYQPIATPVFESTDLFARGVRPTTDDVRARLERNPLRAFDSDHEGTRAALRDAPRLLDRLEAGDADHFREVLQRLDEAGQPYEVDGTLVRGLDYYTRTVFEFTSDAL